MGHCQESTLIIRQQPSSAVLRIKSEVFIVIGVVPYIFLVAIWGFWSVSVRRSCVSILEVPSNCDHAPLLFLYHISANGSHLFISVILLPCSFRLDIRFKTSEESRVVPVHLVSPTIPPLHRAPWETASSLNPLRASHRQESQSR